MVREVTRVRAELTELAERRRGAQAERVAVMAVTGPLVRQGRRLGIGPTELERLTGLSRRTIYDLLGQQET